MFEYDKSSKWLIQHHGDSILRLAGVTDIATWRPLQAEVVQPRQLPDGFLEVERVGTVQPELFVLEIATYPEERLLDQILRDALLVLLDRRTLPEVLAVVLSPRGNLSVAGTVELHSPRGWTELRLDWRVVTVWTIPAETLLGADDVGLIPWVPLSAITGPPEPVLQACRDRIEQVGPELRPNLLAVTQVFAKLRYNDPRLLTILGGRQAMIESPLILELQAEAQQEVILAFLEGRFGSVPAEIQSDLRNILDHETLRKLAVLAARCTGMEEFRKEVPKVPRQSNWLDGAR